MKKLISTSYAADSKPADIPYQLTLFETEAPQYEESKTRRHGKIFTLTRDKNQSGRIDIDDLEWNYLEGDGDFRSEDIKALRDEADIIVTNPPFSLFREFLKWITTANKKFLIIGNQNVITYKEVFSLIKQNKMWLGVPFEGGNAYFKIPLTSSRTWANGVFDENSGLVKFRNCCWLTNLEHGRRHRPLSLMTMDDNIKFSRHKEIRGKGYLKYDNYDAIDVPFTDAIPADYEGVMGVPITYLDKYCPEQFDILGRRGDLAWAETECDFYTPPSPEIQQKYKAMNKTWRVQNTYILSEDGIPQITYGRIFIRLKKDVDKS